LWVIATLAGLAGFIILVLCIPLDMTLNLDTSKKPKFRLGLVWLFGLIGKELGREKKKPKEKRKVTKEKPKKKRRIGFKNILKILRTKGLLRRLKDLVRDVLGQLKIKELVVNLKLGLDDPADTGFLFALIGATTPFLNFPSRYQISVQPSFYGEAVFEGYLHGVLRLWPIKLVWPLLRFIFSLATLRAVKILVLSKWKKKK
jgi:hypothetical protein